MIVRSGATHGSARSEIFFDPQLSFAAVVRIKAMDQFPSENLPPELDELGKRMSEERPVASDRALNSVMTRAQGARRTRKSSLLWRSSAPRTPRKTITMFFVALLATGGMATASQASLLGGGGGGILDGLLGDDGLLGGLLGGSDERIKAPINVNVDNDAADVQYNRCGDASLVRVNLNLQPLLFGCVRLFPVGANGKCADASIKIDLRPVACVRIGTDGEFILG